VGHDIEAGEGQQREHAHPFYQRAAREILAPRLAEHNDRRCGHHDADPVRQQPGAPDIPKWRRGVKRGHARRPADGGGGGSERGCGEKTEHLPDVRKRKRSTKPSLEQPTYQDRFTGVAKSLEQCGKQLQEIGRNRADHHAKDEHWIGTPAAQDEDAGRQPGCGPEHGNIGGLCAQGQTELGGEKIGASKTATLQARPIAPAGKYTKFGKPNGR
jgi:hypothetical protein